MSKTIATEAQTEIIIQKSRFLCSAKPVETEAAAIAFISKLRKQYWDATHNCYAYVIDPHIQKSSDDGEPAGTAGRPILEMIHNRELTHTAIVITRYFGGIKLGTGGLVRAYSQSASAAIEAAGIVTRKLYQQLILTFDYTHLGKLEYELHQTAVLLDAPSYDELIRWSVWVPIEQTEPFVTQCNEWTSGKISIVFGEKMKKNASF
jgi:uncharacterized YigZ family protein